MSLLLEPNDKTAAVTAGAYRLGEPYETPVLEPRCHASGAWLSAGSDLGGLS